MELVIATRNEKKRQEIVELLEGLDVNVRSLSDIPFAPEVIEEGKSFKENAATKAIEVAKFTGMMALADDSGLEVDVLCGEPGLHSARFAGEDQNDEANIQKLLKLMEGVPEEKRKARFRCCVAIAKPEGLVRVVEATCEGIIGLRPEGSYGFGYDPVFIIPDYNQTFAQLGPEVKNRISHRAKALKKARKIICGYVNCAET